MTPLIFSIILFISNTIDIVIAIRKSFTTYQPILIVQGKHDESVHPEAPYMIYRKVNSSMKEIHLMENSTHVVLVDKEIKKVGLITQTFIEKVLQSRPS